MFTMGFKSGDSGAVGHQFILFSLSKFSVQTCVLGIIAMT